MSSFAVWWNKSTSKYTARKGFKSFTYLFMINEESTITKK